MGGSLRPLIFWILQAADHTDEERETLAECKHAHEHRQNDRKQACDLLHNAGHHIGSNRLRDQGHTKRISRCFALCSCCYSHYRTACSSCSYTGCDPELCSLISREILYLLKHCINPLILLYVRAASRSDTAEEPF